MTNAYFIQKLSERVDQLECSLERTYDAVDQLEYDLERTNKQLFELTENYDALFKTVKRNADLVAKHVRWK